ncbi:hypothetical protein [Streptomyces sp. NPDC005141]
MTCCAIESVHGRELTVLGLDAASGTPVIDLQPTILWTMAVGGRLILHARQCRSCPGYESSE